LLFVKAAKVIAVSVAFMPIAGCAVGTGMIFGSLIRGISYSPEQEETMFNYAILGFAFIETFAFMLFGCAAICLFF
jgi:F0F1-type ATP synthase membrane subunit c/vacuolar-type H+-ATPase subunit K